jgi:hypothetical protein
MIWLVWVESTVQVPAQAPVALASTAIMKKLKNDFFPMSDP